MAALIHISILGGGGGGGGGLGVGLTMEYWLIFKICLDLRVLNRKYLLHTIPSRKRRKESLSILLQLL